MTDDTKQRENGPPRILLIASGGVANLGDDAITLAVAGRLRAAHPGADVHVIVDSIAPIHSADPLHIVGHLWGLWCGLTDDDLSTAAAQSSGVVTVDDLRAPEQHAPLLDLRSYERVFISGGGFVTSMWSATHMIPRVAVALRFAALGTPVIWSGQGVGPCTEREMAVLGTAIRTATAFGCRDPLSFEACSAAGGNVALVGDDATRPAAIASLGRRDVVLHVRDAPYVGSDQLEALADIADRLAVKNRGSVIGLAINEQDPPEAATLVGLARRPGRRAAWSVIDACHSAQLAASLTSTATAVVSHSYHVALWALEAGTPAVLVVGSPYYEGKAAGLARLAGFPGSIAVGPEATYDEVCSRLSDVTSWLAASQLDVATGRVDAWWLSVTQLDQEL